MTWEWNHSQEAYDNVYYNISQLSIETLIGIAAEIQTYKHFPHTETDTNFNIYKSKLVKVSNLPKNILVDYIYKFASEQSECTNGGHKAYICPYSCHQVSFDRKILHE
jgi:hypothetical protein